MDKAFLSLIKYRIFLVHWVLGLFPIVKTAGASGWPPALAGVKVGDEWFISPFSLCAFMFLSERDLHFCMHFYVLRCTVTVVDGRWDDLIIESGLTHVQNIYNLNTNSVLYVSLRKIGDQVMGGTSIALLRGLRKIAKSDY